MTLLTLFGGANVKNAEVVVTPQSGGYYSQSANIQARKTSTNDYYMVRYLGAPTNTLEVFAGSTRIGLLDGNFDRQQMKVRIVDDSLKVYFNNVEKINLTTSHFTTAGQWIMDPYGYYGGTLVSATNLDPPPVTYKRKRQNIVQGGY